MDVDGGDKPTSSPGAIIRLGSITRRGMRTRQHLGAPGRQCDVRSYQHENEGTENYASWKLVEEQEDILSAPKRKDKHIPTVDLDSRQ